MINQKSIIPTTLAIVIIVITVVMVAVAWWYEIHKEKPVTSQIINTVQEVVANTNSERILPSDVVACIEGYKNTYRNFDLTKPEDFAKLFAPGKLSATIKSDITKEVVNNLIESKGLELSSYYEPSPTNKTGLSAIAQVLVPEGYELEWVCQLKKEDVFTTVEPVPQPAPLP